MPTKKWIAQRAILYMVAAAITIAMLSIKDNPKFKERIQIDDMRPWISALVVFVAMARWNWVGATARETWEFTRFWAASFLVTFASGVWWLDHTGALSKEQIALMSLGAAIGAIIGSISVIYHLLNDTRIEL